ncbi:hypothetical protein C8R44DRAFT_895047 [Mycena epipterygia]|nr:hypothetical protein C8R44DRAFT_895047 [Mycena epipterygia]
MTEPSHRPWPDETALLVPALAAFASHPLPGGFDHRRRDIRRQLSTMREAAESTETSLLNSTLTGAAGAAAASLQAGKVKNMVLKLSPNRRRFRHHLPRVQRADEAINIALDVEVKHDVSEGVAASSFANASTAAAVAAATIAKAAKTKTPRQKTRAANRSRGYTASRDAVTVPDLGRCEGEC